MSIISGNATSGAQPLTVTISAAQLIAAADVQLVAAPGANKIVVPRACVAVLLVGNVLFTGGNAANALTLSQGPSGDFWLGNNTVDSAIKAATNQVIPFGAQPPGYNYGGDVADAATEFVNQPLNLTFLFGTPYAAGNGTLRVTVDYFTVSLT